MSFSSQHFRPTLFRSVLLSIKILFQQIKLGESKLVVAGGSENMTQVPFAVRNIRFGTALGMKYEVGSSPYFLHLYFTRWYIRSRGPVREK